ncbi:MAG: hypothetical protein V4760_16595 [Bdellovibrionota bacterium]
MGTWKVPYESLKTARRFARLMTSHWPVETDASGSLVGSLGSVVGDDALFDEVGGRWQRTKKSFDMRPIVKRHVRAWLKSSDIEFESVPNSALRIVSEAVGVRLGDDKKPGPKTKKKTQKKAQRAPSKKTTRGRHRFQMSASEPAFIKIDSVFTVKKLRPGSVGIYKRGRLMQVVTQISYAKKLIAKGRF